MAEKLDANTILESINSVVKTAFDERRSILSFQEWFTQLVAHPTRHLRSSSQYVRDVFDHYGSEDIELPYGPVRRYKVFDAPWSKGYGRVAGQEQIQQEIYRLLTNFVRDGRVTRLIMLHGPNG